MQIMMYDAFFRAFVQEFHLCVLRVWAVCAQHSSFYNSRDQSDGRPCSPTNMHSSEIFQLCCAEEEELQQDATALAGEFREVRKLRRLLAAARQEAQQAMADAKPASEASPEAATACSQCWRLQQQVSALQVRHAMSSKGI